MNDVDAPASRRADRWLLLALAAGALALLAATPQLIVPYKADVPWFESAAMFPRAGLALVIVGALAEWWLRRRRVMRAESDELDSSAADLARAGRVLACFAAYALLVPIAGFMVSSLAFLAVAGLVAGVPRRPVAWLALCLSITMWLTFVVGLKVSFGHGWLI